MRVLEASSKVNDLWFLVHQIFPLFYCENLFITEMITHFTIKELDQMIFLVIRIISALKLGTGTIYTSFHHSSWETRHVFQPLNCWSEDKRQKRHTDSQNLEEFSQDKNWASVHHKPELGSSSSVRCVCTLKTRANTRASKPPHNVQSSSINHPLITHFFHVIFPVWAQKAWWNLQNTNCTALH